MGQAWNKGGLLYPQTNDLSWRQHAMEHMVKQGIGGEHEVGSETQCGHGAGHQAEPQTLAKVQDPRTRKQP